MAENRERYEEFMDELRDLLRRYDAEIGMRHSGYGEPKGYGRYDPDVIEVTLEGHGTYAFPSRFDSETM